jgi:hypothetical protein
MIHRVEIDDPTQHPFEKVGLGTGPFKCVQCVDLGKCLSSCDYCGTGIRYQFWIQGVSGDQFKVGCECVRKTYSVGADVRVHVEREMKEFERKNRVMKKLAKSQAQAEAFLQAHPGLSEALDTEHYISNDLKRALARWGSLSEAQVKLAFKLVGDVKIQAEHKAQDEALKANAPAWIKGRQVVEGVILVVKVQDENRFYFATEKMLVQLADGRKCWGTCPSNQEFVKGASISFSADFTPKDGDPTFAWFKRPTQGRVVTLAVES